ncbi:MAG: excalibur calcium-binding domain-containing protein [Caldilineaceae bacterium]|nr:excalibur calcium-binding domain-containing protein [Caldilineaceae bacterium]MDE0198117.1 excalibur calcium-binding domain-containing protein [Caldilineaceae bacterium]MDE0461704.1 excalibur calcium-binding domain-containing protein [Caldilineaceae bacterium]MDE0462974.1 excalibur calcium-binding domain-containing protein [Caldilineaceae bacterium]
MKRLSTDVAALKTRVSTLETGTATPTSTTTPTSSPIPTPYFVVTVERANMREGPGPSFSVITTVSQGDRFNAQAFNPSRTWILFCCVSGRSGWIYEPLLIVTHAERIPIATDIPSSPTYTPTSTASSPTPTRTNTPTPTPTPSNGCYPHDPHGPDLDCKDFNTQREAQACFITAGGPDRDPHRLDGDNDGIACEHLP